MSHASCFEAMPPARPAYSDASTLHEQGAKGALFHSDVQPNQKQKGPHSAGRLDRAAQRLRHRETRIARPIHGPRPFGPIAAGNVQFCSRQNCRTGFASVSPTKNRKARTRRAFLFLARLGFELALQIIVFAQFYLLHLSIYYAFYYAFGRHWQL